MPRTFKDALAEDVTNMLSADEFGESVTFHPASGASRSVVCIVDRSLSFPEVEGGFSSREFADIEVSKDATTGIPDPVLNDAIMIGSDAFSFDSVLESDEQSHTLRFVRDRMVEVGGNRQ